MTTAPGEALVFSPGAPAVISWSATCEQLCLMIPRARLEAELEQLLGRSLRGRLAFDFAAAGLHSPMGRRWRTVLTLLVDELDHPTDVGLNPVVGRHIEGLVLDGPLLGQPHSHTDDAIGDRQVRLGPTIRRAVELIEERPSEPWTTVRLASEVHLSVRALQEGFRRDLATPPMTYLREIRLRRAREALQARPSASLPRRRSTVPSDPGGSYNWGTATASRSALGISVWRGMARTAGHPTLSPSSRFTAAGRYGHH